MTTNPKSIQDRIDEAGGEDLGGGDSTDNHATR
jgi:hypothetical protein